MATPKQQLRHSDIGAWLFKCNPKTWDIEAALSNRKKIDSWRVQPTYRLGLIGTDDPAVLWVTGSDNDPLTPGIWLVGRTTGRFIDGYGDEYWLTDGPQTVEAIYAELRMERLDTPVSRKMLKSDPRTQRMEVLLQPQISNPSYLRPSEKSVVEDLIGGWPN